VTRAIIYLNSIDSQPRGDRDFTPNLITRSDEGVFEFDAAYWAVAYTRQVTKLLPSPYSTQCRNFRTFGFESEYHCQISCASKRVMKRYGRDLFTNTFFKSEQITVLSKKSLYINRTLEKEINTIDLECMSECKGHNCEQIFYAPTVASLMDSDDVAIRLLDPNGPEITTTYQPKTSFPNYCVNVLSILGVWLGLSCMDIIKRAMIGVEKQIRGKLMVMCGSK